VHTCPLDNQLFLFAFKRSCHAIPQHKIKVAKVLEKSIQNRLIGRITFFLLKTPVVKKDHPMLDFSANMQKNTVSRKIKLHGFIFSFRFFTHFSM
jgi:hypothetical protein